MPDLLVAIDMQEVFADPVSGWHAPGTYDLVGPIGALAASGPDVVLTRFVAPAEPQGAWVRYYRDFPWALEPPDSPLYRLVPGLPAGTEIAAPTFSKWGPELAALVGDGTLVLAGVATDCCVLSTAVAAADAGVPVRVVGDACAGSSRAAHEATLAILAGYAPLVSVTTVASEMERESR